jgi:hypothetical protein
MAEREWYYRKGSGAYRASESTLRAMLASGALSPNTQVVEADGAEWVLARNAFLTGRPHPACDSLGPQAGKYPMPEHMWVYRSGLFEYRASESSLRAMIASGDIAPTTPVMAEGRGGWVTAQHAFPPTAPNPGSDPQGVAPATPEHEAFRWEQQPLTPEQRAYLESEIDWGAPVASGLLAVLLAGAVIVVGPDWPWYRIGFAAFAVILAIGAGSSVWSNGAAWDLAKGTVCRAVGPVLLIYEEGFDDAPDSYHLNAIGPLPSFGRSLSIPYESDFERLREQLAAEFVRKRPRSLFDGRGASTEYQARATLTYADKLGRLLEVQDTDGRVVYRDGDYTQYLKCHICGEAVSLGARACWACGARVRGS